LAGVTGTGSTGSASFSQSTHTRSVTSSPAIHDTRHVKPRPQLTRLVIVGGLTTLGGKKAERCLNVGAFTSLLGLQDFPLHCGDLPLLRRPAHSHTHNPRISLTSHPKETFPSTGPHL
jgi:hypothetical protein